MPESPRGKKPRNYRPDLAWIHDSGFGHFARAAAPVLLEALGRQGIKSGLVVEVGCGSGILSGIVAQAGYAVLGIDQSPAMLELARRQAPRSVFRLGSYRTARLPACVAVAAIGEVFNYCFDGTPTLRRLGQVFRRVHRALAPGGVFLFDLSEPGRAAIPYQGWREGKDWLVAYSSEERGDYLTRRIISFRRAGKGYRRTEEVHRLRLFPADAVAAVLGETDFDIQRSAGYGGQLLPHGMTAFLARRRPE